MGDLNSKVILSVIFAAYAVSWFLPIFWRGDVMGYEGARYAQELMESGIKHFVGAEDSDMNSVTEALLSIVAGACNILFIGAALFALFRPVWSYVLAPYAVGSMLLWFSTSVGIGYYVWLISGVSLFAFSFYLVQERQKTGLSSMLFGVWSLPVYAAFLSIGALLVALLLQESA